MAEVSYCASPTVLWTMIITGAVVLLLIFGAGSYAARRHVARRKRMLEEFFDEDEDDAEEEDADLQSKKAKWDEIVDEQTRHEDKTMYKDRKRDHKWMEDVTAERKSELSSFRQKQGLKNAPSDKVRMRYLAVLSPIDFKNWQITSRRMEEVRRQRRTLRRLAQENSARPHEKHRDLLQAIKPPRYQDVPHLKHYTDPEKHEYVKTPKALGVRRVSRRRAGQRSRRYDGELSDSSSEED